MSKRKSGGSFWKVFLIVLLVLIVLIGAGLFVFWKYLAAYEDTLPETVIAAYAEDKGTDYWAAGVRDEALAAKGDFAYEYTEEDVPDVTSLIAKGFNTSKISGESDDDKQVYTLTASGTDIARLTLTPTGEKSFGFRYWSVSDVEFLTGNEQSVTVVVPENVTVAINGKEVPESFVTSRDFEYDVEVKEPFDKAPIGITYKVDGIRGKAEVAVTDENGEELKGEKNGSVLQYPPETQSLYVIADASLTVKAGDFELTDDYTESFNEELLEGFDTYLDASTIACYRCEDIWTMPEITAEDESGKTVEATELLGGGLNFLGSVSTELETAQKPLIDAFARQYVNFSTNAGDDAVANYYALVAYVLPGSELAKRLEGSIEPMSWVDGATVQYKDLKIGDFIPLGENAYMCSLSYAVVNSTGYEDRDVQVTYQLLVVKVGDTWLVANMLAER